MIQVPICFIFGDAQVTNVAKAITHSDFGFTANQLAAADEAHITTRTAGVMYTFDGATTPTATVGHLLAQNETLVLRGAQNVKSLQLVREGSTSADISISLLKYPG